MCRYRYSNNPQHAYFLYEPQMKVAAIRASLAYLERIFYTSVEHVYLSWILHPPSRLQPDAFIFSWYISNARTTSS
jgi:hypothetical protein